MKKIWSLLLIIGVLGLSGCGDKEAREYAAKLIPLLDSYQEQLSLKIKVEQDSYSELADIYEEARRSDIVDQLEIERNRRAEESGEKIANAKDAPSLLQILAPLQEYGKLDFESTQALLQEELDARGKYLTDLESIEIELQKVKALKEALQEMAKSKGDLKKLQEAASFLTKTDEEINKLLCVDLRKQKEQLETDKKDLQKQLEKLKQYEAKEKDDNVKKEFRQKIKQTEQEIKENDQKTEQLIERIDAKKCS